MYFNKYIWDLYTGSVTGKANIENWLLSEDFSNQKYFVPIGKSTIDEFQEHGLGNYILNSKVNWHKIFKDIFSKEKITTDNASMLYQSWIENGLSLNGFKISEKCDYKKWAIKVAFLSKVLFYTFPDYFFLYNFNRCRFDILVRIFNEFSIPLPKIPNKYDWKSRAYYYIKLCDSLFEFRKIMGLSPHELCSFLYDFAPNILSINNESEIPEPSKVWFLGASKDDFKFLDNPSRQVDISWQGSIDSNNGDIAIMYCLSPRSYIHSIWRITGNGFIDPFFMYYSVIHIVNPVKLTKVVSLSELKSNSIWSQCALVKKNFQGINGYPIEYKEYLELLYMLKCKRQDISEMPMIKPTFKPGLKDLLTERDVEIELIEPFLKRLDYNPSDWIRQMPVKMGRGERNFPDYCIEANSTRGEENAKIILESKFEIKTKKDLHEAYLQAKSYALRLQSLKFIIAAKEGLWIFQSNNGIFLIDNYLYYNWIEAEEPDTLFKIKKIVGKQ